MKKFMFILGLITMIGSANAGYVMMSETPITVSEVWNMNDGEYVAVRGVIEDVIDDEEYNFSDSTGDIVVEIEDDVWPPQNITPDDIVIIYGTVDDSWWGNPEIEVDVISVQ